MRYRKNTINLITGDMGQKIHITLPQKQHMLQIKTTLHMSLKNLLKVSIKKA